MGQHHAKNSPDVVVGDPDAPAVFRLWQWWWAFPLAGLVMLPVAPLASLACTAAFFGLGYTGRAVVAYTFGPRRGIVLVPGTELGAWRDAHESIGRIRSAWPSLGTMAEPADIGPALQRARWGLAVLLHRRAGVSRALRELEDAGHGLAAEAPLRAQLALRHTELAARVEEISGQIAQRLGALRRLAEVAGEHAHRQRRAEQARRALRRAQDIDADGPPGPDALAELADRTAAVLAAYRELSALPRPDTAPPGEPSSGTA